MEYTLNSKQVDQKILSEILQNGFAKFDDSIIRWKFNNEYVNCTKLENKIINIYSNKNQIPKNSKDIIYSDWIDIFDEGLLELNKSYKQPILFFSGGKDSTFIAARMKKNNIDGFYYSLVKNNKDKKIVLDLAEKLKIKVHFANHELKYLNFEEIFKKIKEPVMDPAGLSLLLLLDINFENKISFKDSVFIDGMGNDTYMGHLPGKRELQKMFFQKYITKFNIHNFFSINFMNKLGKWGDLFRPDYMANFPGSKIKLHNYFNQVSYFKKYTEFNDDIIQRALQRGIHYDFGSAISKSILYVNACDETSGVYFPFQNDKLIDHYEKRKVLDYDYSKFTNKLSIRKYLNDELNFDNISPKKGIFKPSFLEYKFCKRQIELSKQIDIKISKLNKFQQSDFYLWSKYLINNDINYDIN